MTTFSIASIATRNQSDKAFCQRNFCAEGMRIKKTRGSTTTYTFFAHYEEEVTNGRTTAVNYYTFGGIALRSNAATPLPPARRPLRQHLAHHPRLSRDRQPRLRRRAQRDRRPQDRPHLHRREARRQRPPLRQRLLRGPRAARLHLAVCRVDRGSCQRLNSAR